MADIKAIRDRARHYLSAEVAAAAGLRLADLQQFIGGTFYPTSDQLARLARRIGL